MYKNNHANHSKQGTSAEVTNYTRTGYSNSRLGVHFRDTPSPKLSFDGMTIVGNL
ncbi:replication initiation protein, partial [Staphylococcus aureus]|nr:replication initiation protein [Staphylococcus aureus]